MGIRRIALRLNYRQFSKLVALANTTIAAITGNLSYPSPSPTMADMMTATTDVVDAIAAWGVKGSRGSHAAYVDLCIKAKVLLAKLRALADYCNNAAIIAANGNNDELVAILTSSGFDLNKLPSEQPVLEAVRRLRTSIMRNLNSNQVKIVFERPLNTTSRQDVNHYEVRRSTTSMYSDSVVVASLSKTSYIDTNNTGVNVTWTYWITAYNSKGPGAVSQALPVTVMGIIA